MTSVHWREGNSFNKSMDDGVFFHCKKKERLMSNKLDALLPSGVSDEVGIKRAVVIIERAVKNGRSEVQVYRFPNALLTDRGRAINQQEKGWEKTLTGVPKEIYDLWERHFRDRGYKLRCEIVEFSGGMPGDVALTLSWA